MGLAVIVSIILIRNNYTYGVKKYKTIYLGMDSVEKPGDKTGWAPPDDIVPEDIKFLVYSLNDENSCMGWGCGMGGYFVECLGGWISGFHTDAGEVYDYGMVDEGINIFKEKYVTVADKNGKVVGIYPDAGIKNIPYIMRNHKDLVPSDTFKRCFDQLSSKWK